MARAWLGRVWLGRAWLGRVWLGRAWLGGAWHGLHQQEGPVGSRTVSFTVWGVPVAKGRPRFGRGPGGHVRTWTPEKTVAYEARVRAAAVEAMRGAPLLTGPLRASIRAYWPARKAPKSKPRPATPKTTRPDADNVAKAVADALNGTVYRDDAQVVALVAEKWHAATGEPARTEVVVEELGP